MSACATCPRPGACCVAFPLSLPLPRDYEQAKLEWQEWLARTGLNWPFELLRPLEDGAQREWQQYLGAGDKVIWRFTCPKLGADGRCTIYAERPQPCRDFEPLSDSLCVLHEPNKGRAPVSDDSSERKEDSERAARASAG